MQINELMESVGCSEFPSRWNDFYYDTVATVERELPYVLDEGYLDFLKRKYGFVSEYEEYYRDAAAKIRKNKDLTLFVALLLRAVENREEIHNDLRELSLPEDSFEKRMIPALVMLSGIPKNYAEMKGRKIPDDIISVALHTLEGGIPSYMLRRGGEVGYSFFGWFQLAYDGKLYNIGSLQIELGATFDAGAVHFVNSHGEGVSLADNILLHRDGAVLGSLHYEDNEGSFEAVIEECALCYEGYPYNELGRVENKKIKLEKSEWKKVIGRGSSVVGLHIPAGARLDKESLDFTFDSIKAFLEKHFPEYEYTAFYCHSWMLDPSLCNIVRPDSNILGFLKRFIPLAVKSSGEGVFKFVFMKPNMDFNLDELSENTSLQRGIKKLYKNGGAIYETAGFFLK